ESRNRERVPAPLSPPCPPPQAGAEDSGESRLGRPLCPHADLLSLLEELALVLDRRRNHQLRLLELAQGRGSAYAHRRTEGADQVLRAVIDPRRAQQDLAQCPPLADFDTSPAWEVRIRGRHPPVIAAAGSVRCAGEDRAH